MLFRKVDTIAPAEGCQRAFFRIVKKDPGRQRVLGGKKFTKNQLAVSLLQGLSIPGQPHPGVNLDLSPIDASHISVFSFEQCDMEWLRRSLLAHDEHHDMQYHYPGFELAAGHGTEQSELSEIIDKVISAAALPGMENTLDVPPWEHVDLLEAMVAFSYVQEVALGKWRLTSEGLQHLKVHNPLSAGIPALGVRALVPVTDRSAFELLCMLEDDGWGWKRLHVSKVARDKFGLNVRDHCCE